jgi:3-oxoacyl-[acyl-carrier protein] reductase
LAHVDDGVEWQEEPLGLARQAVSAALELGGIDILVNDAGIAAMAPIDDYRLEDCDRMLVVNLRAVFVATQRAGP